MLSREVQKCFFSFLWLQRKLGSDGQWNLLLLRSGVNLAINLNDKYSKKLTVLQKKFVLVKLECFFESVQVKIEWKSISDFLWFHWTMSASGAKNILVYSLNFSSIQFGSYLHQLRRTCLTLFAHVHVLKLLSVNLENVTSFMVDQPS